MKLGKALFKAFSALAMAINVHDDHKFEALGFALLLTYLLWSDDAAR